MIRQEDFVSFELAKKLKEAGYYYECGHYWFKEFINQEKFSFRSGVIMDYNNDDWYVPHFSAPSLYDAHKWLRKIHALFVNVSPVTGGRWTYEIQDLKPTRDESGEFYNRIPERSGYPVIDTYEMALSEGINEALNII